ncbi:MAG: hypothetical protein L6Q59_01010 [Ignavibacteriaceae bacterium]|nr:hypothetical protein [Ignavibacteriaceae bacterium]
MESRKFNLEKMSITDKILSHPVLREQPPVLVDIGASGEIDKKWKKLAPYSICLIFDADDREFGYSAREDSGFKKLYVYNSIVSDISEPETDFYLTKSPYCSSSLEPDAEGLADWFFADKFTVEKKVRLKNKTLKAVLEEVGLTGIDWFKSDSQGTDLRLYKNIPDEIRKKVLAAEIEPGFIDSYKGEDKFYDVIRELENEKFWISDMIVKGSQRLNMKLSAGIFGTGIISKLVTFSQKKSPGWAEITFLKKLSEINDKRGLLLLWLFAVVEKQYGFSLEAALKGKRQFGDENLFDDMISYSRKNLVLNTVALRFLPAVFEKLGKMV